MLVIKDCLWCGAAMHTHRSSKTVCSKSCANEMNYIHKRDFQHLSSKEFKQVIENHIENGTHLNPNHPLAQLDNAIASVWSSLTTLLKAASAVEQQEQQRISETK